MTEGNQRSLHVEQAIVDAVGGAMMRNRTEATIGDLVAAVLRSSALSKRSPVGLILDSPFRNVIQCADRAARERKQITDLADILQCILDECADALASQPDAEAIIEAALAEARLRPRFASALDESKATMWRVEITRASGRRQNQYFTTSAQAQRELSGLPPTGDGIQMTGYGVTDDDANDPVATKRLVPPGGE